MINNVQLHTHAETLPTPLKTGIHYFYPASFLQHVYDFVVQCPFSVMFDVFQASCFIAAHSFFKKSE